MFGVLAYIRDYYDEFIRSGDPRVTKWPLMKGPGPVLIMLTLYVLFVKIIGPWLMKDRKPFDLKIPMLLFNIAVVLLYTRMIIEVFIILFRTRDRGICRKETLTDPYGIRMAELGWFYICLKLVEFLDTVFFVLRKKSQQISKLHVIHHAITPIANWAGFRVVPGSYNIFFPVFNSIVHIVMYSYYGLSVLGPNVQKYLWWKKYLTALQMTQFAMVFLYMLLLLVSGCEVSKFVVALNTACAGLFLVMFIDFYKKSYVKEKVNHRSYENRQSGSQGIQLDAVTKKHSLCFNNGIRERRTQN